MTSKTIALGVSAVLAVCAASSRAQTPWSDTKRITAAAGRGDLAQEEGNRASVSDQVFARHNLALAKTMQGMM